MYKIFDTLAEYNQFTDNGTKLISGVTYYIKEDGSSHFQTNNIDGEEKVYEMKNNEDLIDLLERNITTFNIPNGTTTIGGGAFFNCSGLTSVTIPDSVTTIEQQAFQQCTGLTSITIPNSVTSIGAQTFYQCKGLTSVTIGSGVTSINKTTFRECTRLTSITIPDSVTSIGNGVFYGCTSLTSITIPNSVTNIDDGAFNGCTSLTSVTIQATTPPTLGKQAFGNNATGRKIYVPDESVEAYKTATNWSQYAADIKPLSEYVEE